MSLFTFGESMVVRRRVLFDLGFVRGWNDELHEERELEGQARNKGAAWEKLTYRWKMPFRNPEGLDSYVQEWKAFYIICSYELCLPILGPVTYENSPI
ncbi:MAG: hypothetical protein JRN68_06720 [Nitrososphaerota archaeon]|jgi:hypothetical protein|nr:hypothetical protein [Nitrososphaerota archaeon]